MKLRLLAVLWLGAAASLGSLACSSVAEQGTGPAGGAAGVSGASNPGAGGGSAGSAGQVASACPENPSPLRTQGTVLSLPIELFLADKPFIFGQANALLDGSLTPLNFRFYISEVQLLRADGEPLAVDLLTEAGTPTPYGVHLFNAEDPDSSTVRLLAPAGEYTGLSFALGIPLACNRQIPAHSSDPLTDASQMTWPFTGGFLFLRYEARYSGTADANSAAASALGVHMGGNIAEELVPSVTVSSALSIPASGTLEKGLNVMMEEIFKGATSDTDVSDASSGILSTSESQAGERLRRQLPELHVFVLEP